VAAASIGLAAAGLDRHPRQAAAQSPAPPAEVERHIAAARATAGVEHAGHFERLCAQARAFLSPPAPRGGGAGGRGGAGRQGGPPPRESWHAEPVTVFDNLHFVGQTEFSAWAVTTSAGIIVIDAIYDYSVEDEVVGGLKKLGFDPAQIRYVIVSHGHADHAAGAKLLQERFGARVIMSAADWEMVEQQNPPWKPRRDLVATDGQALTLGDTTLTLHLTPGHTPGTISTLVPVRDGARRHVAALWGGTLFNFGPIRDRLLAYADSAARFRDIVTKVNAEVLLSNHTEYDGSKVKLPALAARRAGDRHPYVVGNDSVRRYLTVANECALAAVAAVDQRGPG
jgi:metallo-beta-lactamase class B